SGQPEQALPPLEQAAALDGQLAQARNNLGAALIAAGRPQPAVAHLQAAAELDPTSPQVFINLASAYRLTGDLAQAAQAYAHAFELDPTQLEARARWAGVIAALAAVETDPGKAETELAAARQAWEEIAAADHAAAGALAQQGLGILAVRDGLWQTAVDHLQAAQAIHPGDPLTSLYLGLAYEGLAQPEEAARQYSQALLLSQGSAVFPAGPAQQAQPAAPAMPEETVSRRAQERLLALLPLLQSGQTP
ncbi:MAG: tetratricopeptide repeat protein, partial [Chloroflexota bacterium]